MTACMSTSLETEPLHILHLRRPPSKNDRLQSKSINMVARVYLDIFDRNYAFVSLTRGLKSEAKAGHS